MRFAADVSDLELGDYQRAVRLLLRHPLISATWPDDKALGRVRRFSADLRRDLSDAFGYRLELHGSTARLVRAGDAFDPDRPAVSRTGRPFDRRRYAYLALSLAVAGRAGIQLTLSELADAVASDANRIGGLGFDPDQGADRRALVDAVGWLEERGVLRTADGSTASWAGDPRTGEALYDVARDLVFSLFRPPRVLQHVASAGALLDRAMAGSGNAERRAVAQAARRAVVQSPVVYYADVPAEVSNHLRAPALAADLARLTGLRVERRAEGVLLVDTARLSVEQFPGTGAVAQAALLLAAAMAERVTDPDGRRARRLAYPGLGQAQALLAAQIDAGLPDATRVVLAEPEVPPDDPDDPDELRYPFITDSTLREVVAGILGRYAAAFGSAWHADPERLRVEAVALLHRFGMVTPVPGGVLVRPLTGRYRGAVAQVRERTLF